MSVCSVTQHVSVGNQVGDAIGEMRVVWFDAVEDAGLG
jgi:hypothetical protein